MPAQEEDEDVDPKLLTPRSLQAYKDKKVAKVAAERKTRRQVRQFISDGFTFIYFCIVFTIGDLRQYCKMQLTPMWQLHSQAEAILKSSTQ